MRGGRRGEAMNSRRLFFALWPGEGVREQIQNADYPRLKDRTTPRENWHTTLVFLGPSSASQQEGFERAAATLSARPFELTLDVTGYFRKARVAWLGCQHPPSQLMDLQRELEHALRASCPRHPAFYAEERVFRPHLTLYRNIRHSPRARQITPIHWAVSEFCLVESRPSERPVYTILKRWPLCSDGGS